MIIGLGLDMAQISRIARVYKRFGARFVKRCFTGQEASLCLARIHPENALALRFAAKEACAKALGLGMRGLNWQDMEVGHDEAGKPLLSLHGKALERMNQLGATHCHISLSDDGQYAVAVVIMEKN